MLEIVYNRYCSQNDLSMPQIEAQVLSMEQHSFLCCPYCRNMLKKPVTLPCGHSLCSSCCQNLLERNQRHRNHSSGSTYTYASALRQNRIRMGVNSLRYPQTVDHLPRRHRYRPRHLASSIYSLNKIEETPTTPLAVPMPSCSRFVIRSPQCPTCYAPPSAVSPIQNLTLSTLIDFWNSNSREKASFSEIKRNTSPTNSSSSSGFEESEDLHNSSSKSEDCCIQKFNIAIIGAPGVGKSRLARTQYLNRIFFGTIEDIKELTRENESLREDDSRRSDPELQAKFMIEILDNNDMSTDLKAAHGIVLTYSIADKSSFDYVEKMVQEIGGKNQKEVPIILLATKADLEQSKRVVSTQDGENLAKDLGCMFFEVSAKKNDGVNEAFTELVQLIEKHQTEEENLKGGSIISSN